MSFYKSQYDFISIFCVEFVCKQNTCNGTREIYKLGAGSI